MHMHPSCRYTIESKNPCRQYTRAVTGLKLQKQHLMREQKFLRPIGSSLFTDSREGFCIPTLVSTGPVRPVSCSDSHLAVSTTSTRVG